MYRSYQLVIERGRNEKFAAYVKQIKDLRDIQNILNANRENAFDEIRHEIDKLKGRIAVVHQACDVKRLRET